MTNKQDGLASLSGAGRHRRLADSDSDSDVDAPASNVLTAARASELCPKPFRLIAKSLSLTHIGDLSSLTALDYVDISDNALQSTEGLSELPGLKTLILRKNCISSLEHILHQSGIRVLNVAENSIFALDWVLRANFAPNLNALIINGNQLTLLDGITALASLETLVISHNKIEDISLVGHLPRLKKLSVSHNEMRAIPDSISNCSSLLELRVSHNRLAALPREQVLARLSALRILDIGHNRLTALGELSVLGDRLEQLNVAGNPIANNVDKIKEHVLQLCPGIQIFDGIRITGGRRKVRLARERRLQIPKSDAKAFDAALDAGHRGNSRWCRNLQNLNVKSDATPVFEHDDGDNSIDAEEFLKRARMGKFSSSLKAGQILESKEVSGTKRKRTNDDTGEFEMEAVGQWGCE